MFGLSTCVKCRFYRMFRSLNSDRTNRMSTLRKEKRNRNRYQVFKQISCSSRHRFGLVKTGRPGGHCPRYLCFFQCLNSRLFRCPIQQRAPNPQSIFVFQTIHLVSQYTDYNHFLFHFCRSLGSLDVCYWLKHIALLPQYFMVENYMYVHV